MAEFCSWLRLRKVYINSLFFLENDKPLVPQWRDLLSWCADSVHKLYICSTTTCVEDNMSAKYRDDFLVILSWASCYLTRLQSLKMELPYQLHPAVAELLVHNNTGTLVTLTIKNNDNILGRPEPYQLSLKFCSFPHLRVLQWVISELRDIICLSPNLVALYVPGGDGFPASPLFSAIASNCPQLQRLHCICIEALSNDALLLIARCCPYLEYLALQCCEGLVAADLVDVVCALPRLHTLLVTNIIPEWVLLEIVLRGHTSLRVLDTYTQNTYGGLQLITAALPQLTGLAIYNVSFIGVSGTTYLLKHCQSLEMLKLDSDDDVLEAVLQSVAACCPNLHTLMIASEISKYQAIAIDAVVEACSQLRSLQFEYWPEYAEPHNRAVPLQISWGEQDLKLADWMPGWA